MQEVPILINITFALVVAFIGGTIARHIGLPTIVGYLLAGVVIGPFTPGFVGDVNMIMQLADLGVIFLMFGVGLHFSFHDLWRVRDIAIPGAPIQAAITTLLGFGLTRLWGWDATAGVMLGLAISVASTVVLLKRLMDNSLLNTSHGQAAVGWLVMEDILSVSILILMPIFATSADGFDWQTVGLTLLKAAAFIALMLFIGVRLFPWMIEKIAHTRSRELFLLAALAITLGSAIGASQLFGVSMALGAFIAGAIISQSRLSHQVGVDLFAFREAFSVLFFVSVGMLVNPLFLWENLGQVAALSLLIIVGKTVIVIMMGLVMPRPARTFLIIAIGLGQIGEFSFILGRSAVNLKMLGAEQYSLILAAALISIAVNPFMYKLLPVLETTLQRLPWFWKRFELHVPIPEIQEDQLVDHVVIIGFGRVGKHMVSVLESLSIPLLVIEADAERMAILNQRHIPTLYGDAGNSDVIVHAHLERARALVTTVPDESAAMMIVTAARDLNPDLQIIARAATEDGVRHMIELGADHVVHPELEGGLELMHHTLLSLGFPLSEVHHFAETVRRDRYDFDITTDAEHRSLHDLLLSMKGIEIVWMSIDAAGSLVGKSLAEANLRAHTGASVVALVRNGQLTANPKSMTVFEPGDRIGVIGEKEQIEVVQGLLKMA